MIRNFEAKFAQSVCSVLVPQNMDDSYLFSSLSTPPPIEQLQVQDLLKNPIAARWFNEYQTITKDALTASNDYRTLANKYQQAIGEIDRLKSTIE